MVLLKPLIIITNTDTVANANASNWIAARLHIRVNAKGLVNLVGLLVLRGNRPLSPFLCYWAHNLRRRQGHGSRVLEQ